MAVTINTCSRLRFDALHFGRGFPT